MDTLRNVLSPGYLSSLPDKLHEMEVFAAVSPVPGMLFGTAKVLNFFLPKQNNPTKEQAGAPPCLQRPVFKALTHLDSVTLGTGVDTCLRPHGGSSASWAGATHLDLSSPRPHLHYPFVPDA